MPAPPPCQRTSPSSLPSTFSPPFEGSRPPRLRDARITLACTCHEIHELGDVPQSLILGGVLGLYLDDSILIAGAEGRPRVDPRRLAPLARLGACQYAALGDILHLARPGRASDRTRKRPWGGLLGGAQRAIMDPSARR